MTESAAELIALAKSYDAGAAWEEAASISFKFILLVLKNNPGKSITKIVKRPDAKDALVYPFAHAGAVTKAAINEAWFNAAGDRELSIKDLTRTLKTAQKNAVAMPTLVRKLLMATKREDVQAALDSLAKQMKLRAELGVQYASARAKTLAQIDDAVPGSTKTWHSLDWPNRCAYCLALDGVTIPVDAVFDAKAGGEKLGTYGTLLGPPRHPNCRCWLTFSAP